MIVIDQFPFYMLILFISTDPTNVFDCQFLRRFWNLKSYRGLELEFIQFFAILHDWND